MNKILAFDSLYMVKPLRKIYIFLIKNMLNGKNFLNNRLVLYRLDRDNIFIREEQNISGLATGLHKDKIETMSIKFYDYLMNAGFCDGITIKNLQIYKLYTRQVKLKLASLIICAYRIKNISIDCKGELEIITDKQTVSIMKETFSFLQFEPVNIIWKTRSSLTCCVTINSFFMRAAAIFKMITTSSDLPKDYYHKYSHPNLPTVLVTMPKRRPEDFFSTYVKKFESQFNVILYSAGFLQKTPENYKRIKVKQKFGFLKGMFNTKMICFNAESYIADILLIFEKHFNLSQSIDIVNSVFSNKIDAHISRLQTNVVDNYFAIEARRKGVFILGDVMEEIFYCDSAICASASENTEPFRLALANKEDITYKMDNSLIKYRLKNFENKYNNYLHSLLGINTQDSLIFYASDPSKDESQRYLTEKFLIDFFYRLEDYTLIIKTHPQDNGNITNYAYQDSKSPSNVYLIGDIAQKNKVSQHNFQIFESFNFNAAIGCCDGFLTSSSSSILQALMLGIKTGIIDRFENGHYDYLITSNASMLINNEESFKTFLEKEQLNVKDEILSYCGLSNNKKEFDVGKHLLICLEKINYSSTVSNT